MDDYPHTLEEFEARFATEQACRDYLIRLRWPDGFRCPRCGQNRAWPIRALRLQCAACDYQVSVTAGTIFQDTHKPLRTWFRALWWVTSPKTGASALGLQRALGLGGYQTAWTWLHKLRRAMVRPGRDRLPGRVEVDETYLGGPEAGREGRPTAGIGRKVLEVIAAQEDGRGIGRIRMRRIERASAPELMGFLQEAVDPGAIVRTDGWAGYNPMEKLGYHHEVVFLKDNLSLLPRVHRVASLLKRWLLGTHHGAVRPKHLDYYLDEFTFRFNRRNSRYRGKLFYRLAQQAMASAPAPYENLTQKTAGRNPNRLGLPESIG
jgi:transposase-like protein